MPSICLVRLRQSGSSRLFLNAFCLLCVGLMKKVGKNPAIHKINEKLSASLLVFVLNDFMDGRIFTTFQL